MKALDGGRINIGRFDFPRRGSRKINYALHDVFLGTTAIGGAISAFDHAGNIHFNYLA